MCKYVLKRRKSLTLLPVSPGMLSVAGCPLGLIRQQRGFEAEEHKPGGQGYEGQQKGGYGMKGCREEEEEEEEEEEREGKKKGGGERGEIKGEVERG